MGFFSSRKGADIGAMLAQGNYGGLLSIIRGSSDYALRKKAIMALGKSKTEDALSILVKSLELGDGLLRIEAVNALSTFTEEKATSALIVSLQDPDPMVRECAAKALGKTGSSIASQYLTKLLSDNKLFVRKAATDAIEAIRAAVQAELDKITPRDDGGGSDTTAEPAKKKNKKRKKSTPSGGAARSAKKEGDKKDPEEPEEGEEKAAATADGEYLAEDEEEKAVDYSKISVPFPEGISDTYMEDMLTMTIVATMDQRKIEIDIQQTLDEEYPIIQYGIMKGRQRTRIFDELIRTKSMKLYRLDEMHSRVVSERKLNDVGENDDKTYFVFAILPKIPPEGLDIDNIRKRLKRRVDKVKHDFFPRKKK